MKVAEGVREDALHTHKIPRLHLGHFQTVTPSSLHILALVRSAAAHHLVFLIADEAHMSVLARVGGATSTVPSLADFDI